jgi:hypothetical protein
MKRGAKVNRCFNGAHGSGMLEGMENLIKGMEGLEINHKALSHSSTWPWAAETPRGLVTALLFPLIVYLGQWLLQRILGS